MINGLENNALAALAGNASKPVLNAIRSASAKSGVDFAYLVQQAKAESNFDPDVKAKTSSATGLYQFINKTWLSMVDRYGEKHGIETDSKSRQEILDLRKDPEIAANMAAEFAGENERYLNNKWAKGEKDVGSTELYFAHFLGAPKAAAFLNARDNAGHQPAAVIFPKAAKANYNVFYERGTGRAKSLDEVYAFFDKKFDIKDLDPAALAPEPPKPEPTENKGGLYKPDSVIFTNPRSYSPVPQFQLMQNPLDIMLLSQLRLPGVDSTENSIF